MFKLDDNEDEGTIVKNWPVMINVPQDGGGIRKYEISADFLLLPQDIYDEQVELSRAADGNVDADMLRRVVKRLGGVADTEGKPMDYTPELLDKLIKKGYFRTSLFGGYNEANSGQKAKRKN